MLKTCLRKAGARTKDVLEGAIADALKVITQHDAHGSFQHCGYQTQCQPL